MINKTAKMIIFWISNKLQIIIKINKIRKLIIKHWTNYKVSCKVMW